MQEQLSRSLFSRFNDILTTAASIKKPASETEMRLLNEEELRAVAGGPECEVGTGL